ncbi:MAG: Endonuclease/Exonuclease/phosphatase family protein [Planctomycetes bacterium ADurb.Bin401]|nr:MAG: Endonuclease/Exonuclease/phosphatase family protein [Planctomycetes bacterium ADurb.Bin401]
MKKQTVFIVYSILFFSAFLVTAAKAAETQAIDVKTMSFNVRVDVTGSWGGRKNKVAKIMNDQNPDIIGVQEALNHQVTDIQKSLRGYANYAVGRNDGKTGGESCAIFYKKDRFTLNDKGTFWFSDTPDKVSQGWDAWPRICTWVHLTDKNTGKAFYVYNVHLAAFFASGARNKSAELIAERVAARKTNDPFIVMGDFNMKTTSKGMRYLLNREGKTPYARMTDAWDTIYPDVRGPRYDHITLSKEIRPTYVELDKRKASDHYALIANLQISSPIDISSPIAAGEAKELERPVQN